jgi:hypothetical protein
MSEFWLALVFALIAGFALVGGLVAAVVVVHRLTVPA